MDGVCWVCFRCQHSPIKDMSVRFFWVCAMECMFALIRLRFILSSQRVVGNGVRTHVNSKGKINPVYQRRIEPVVLHHTGQRDQHSTDWAILPPSPPNNNNKRLSHSLLKMLFVNINLSISFSFWKTLFSLSIPLPAPPLSPTHWSMENKCKRVF